MLRRMEEGERKDYLTTGTLRWFRSNPVTYRSHKFEFQIMSNFLV